MAREVDDQRLRGNRRTMPSPAHAGTRKPVRVHPDRDRQYRHRVQAIDTDSSPLPPLNWRNFKSHEVELILSLCSACRSLPRLKLPVAFAITSWPARSSTPAISARKRSACLPFKVVICFPCQEISTNPLLVARYEKLSSSSRLRRSTVLIISPEVACTTSWAEPASIPLLN